MAPAMLYLVRHAHAVWQPDEARPLSESGRAAAQALGQLLAAKPIAAIYSSPARRAIETVEPLAQRLGIGVVVVPELRERQLPAIPEGDFDRVVRETWRLPTSTMAHGESNVMAQGRALTAVRQFIARHAEEHLVVATHGNLLALILNGFDSRFGHEFWRTLSFPDVYELEFEAGALIRVRRMWDIAA
jgi:2,3-bisphosphoglycerate-dependent phosphoglycerate mutase